jgi:hypothetical protein
VGVGDSVDLDVVDTGIWIPVESGLLSEAHLAFRIRISL